VALLKDGNKTIVRATWKGDANCDGVINADDLSLMLLGQARQQTTWSVDDFDHDNQINADDWAEFSYALAYSEGKPYQATISTASLSAADDTGNLLMSAPSM
jgi:hypothetical protein